MYSGITVGCITTIGNKHISRNIPCEDASLAICRDGVSVVVIADGAGGKQYTDARFGSASAVETVANLLCDHFDVLYQENREASVRSYIMANIRVAFSKIMQERSLDSLDRLSCTLLFVAVKDRRMMIGHIGDGLVVRISPSGVSPISMPQNDRDGKTYFVTAAHAEHYLRLIKTTTDDCHAIALMTDGVQDSVYNEQAGLVKPVVVKMAEVFKNGRQAGEQAAMETVKKYIVGGSNMSDDASFGVLFFDGTEGPDTEKLEVEAESFPSAKENFKELLAVLKPKYAKASEIIQGREISEPVVEKAEEKSVETTVDAEKISEPTKTKASKATIAWAVVAIALFIALAASLILK